MVIVGIDIAKYTHVAAVMNQEGEPLGKPIKVANSTVGFERLMAHVNAFCQDIRQIRFGMEATGHYWLNLYTHLLDLDTTVHVINPVQSDALRGLYIRQTKTDTVDAVIIADVIRIGRYSETTMAQPDLLALRDLSRQRFYLVDMISGLKHKVLALLDRVFPEYPTLFSDTFGATSLELLSSYTTPEDLLAVDTETLCDILSKKSRGRFGQDKALEIKQRAETSFGALLCTDSLSFMLKQFVEQIRFLEGQLEDLNAMISERLTSLNTPITSISGIGDILGAAIISEIGDIHRFETPDKLAAFAGIDPTVRQSGQFTGTHARMSKRGSPYLRRAIWLAASNAIDHDPAIKAFYDRKKAQGKHHYTCVGYICRKLINIIFAVLKSNQPYQPVFPKDFA